LSSSASTASTSSSTSTTTTITFSVWDGDWAVLEEYTTGNVLVESYVQGYHGLVKTLVSNIYYYQDELGSTSHVAGGTGALIESYQYDLYGKPRVYNSGGTYQPNATPLAKDLGNGGARWIPEIGLYDDRNRFMSPDLGRFLQPDPIGFKGDASNLYRYVGNDWANKTDPTGLGERESNPILQEQIRYNEQLRNSDRGAIMSQMLNVGRINVRDAVKDMAGFTMNGTPSSRPDPSFRVDAKPITVGGLGDPRGASGSVFTIQFKTDAKGYDHYELDQQISTLKNGEWSSFRKDTDHPLPNQRSTKDGAIATDQAGKWVSGHPANSATRANVAVTNFEKFGQRMRTSGIGVKPNGGRDVLATHQWGAIYHPDRAPQYEGTNQWYNY